jgi:amphi-Trp domain-containing protein
MRFAPSTEGRYAISDPIAQTTPREEIAMAVRKISKRKRDVEKHYPVNQFIRKLRRLADTLENGEDFRIQVAGERVRVPARVTINIEHERGDDSEEIEFQLRWPL